MEGDDIIGLYERHADRWVRARLRSPELAEKGWLDQFSTLLPAHGAVLDCGCGAGEPIATYLVGAGFSVVGVDSSTAMVGKFKARLPDQRAVVRDMRSLSLGVRFQGILAWDSFFHLNDEDQRLMFPVFAAHADAGAALMFTSGTSHGIAIGSLEGEALFHASLDPTEYRSLLGEHGFKVVSTVAEDPDCGGRTVWLAQQIPG